jgi:hypothetical protein
MSSASTTPYSEQVHQSLIEAVMPTVRLNQIFITQPDEAVTEHTEANVGEGKESHTHSP